MRARTPSRALVTSRSAENLFWLGRCTERAENTIRLARLTLRLLQGEQLNSPKAQRMGWQLVGASTAWSRMTRRRQ